MEHEEFYISKNPFKEDKRALTQRQGRTSDPKKKGMFPRRHWNGDPYEWGKKKKVRKTMRKWVGKGRKKPSSQRAKHREGRPLGWQSSTQKIICQPSVKMRELN